MQRLIGDVKSGLEKLTELSCEEIIQDNLFFNHLGLCDYSEKDKLGGKRVSEWIEQARVKYHSSDPEDYFPKNIKISEDFEIEFAPTFQKLRDTKVPINKSGNMYFIQGKNFGESICNFLELYNSVISHLKWEEQKESEMIRCRKFSLRGPPTGRLILKGFLMSSK